MAEVAAILNTIDTAIRACQTEFTDNIYLSSPLTDKMFAAKKVKPGKPIHIPHKKSKSGTAAWSDIYDEFTYARSDTIFAPAMGWAYCMNTDFLPREDLELDRGEAAVVDLMPIVLEGLLNDIKDLLSDAIYQGNPDASPPQITGLETVCSASNTYANIDRSSATYAEWRSAATDVSGELSKEALDGQIDAIRQWGDWPDFIVTTPTVESAMVNTWATPFQIIESRTNPQISWKGLNYKGIPVFADPKCPAGNLYVLTMKYMNMYVPTSGQLFKVERFADESSFAGVRFRIFQTLQLVCREPKLQRRLYGITGITT